MYAITQNDKFVNCRVQSGKIRNEKGERVYSNTYFTEESNREDCFKYHTLGEAENDAFQFSEVLEGTFQIVKV
jgi:hypothetical protein